MVAPNFPSLLKLLLVMSVTGASIERSFGLLGPLLISNVFEYIYICIKINWIKLILQMLVISLLILLNISIYFC